jgi:hypothetical protein
VKVAGAAADGTWAVPRARAALPPVLEPALGRGRPVARAGRLSDDPAVVRAPALNGAVPRVVSAALAASVRLPPATPRAPAPVARRHAAAWLGAGLLLAALLQAISLLVWRDVPVALGPVPWTLPDEAPHEDPDAAAATPEPGARELADAINAELQRVGVDVEVELADDRTATVSGRVGSVAEHDSLLEWLQTVPGVGRIDDRLELAPVLPPQVTPRPEPAARPLPRTSPAPTGDPMAVARPPAPAIETPPRPSPAAPPPRPSTAAPPVELARVPPPAPVLPEPAAPPNAEAIARTLQRELARLGLPDVSAEVDPATLQITLRGRTPDAARKAQALAAARAANPGGRVRDLVFLVEE